MDRQNIRQPSPAGEDLFEERFRSPTANYGRSMFSSTPRPFRDVPSLYYGQSSSPNVPFNLDVNHIGYTQAGGRPRNHSSFSPRGQNAILPCSSFRHNARRQEYHGSHRTTHGFGTQPLRDSTMWKHGIEKYYSPCMMQDPWAGLQPAVVPDIIRK